MNADAELSSKQIEIQKGAAKVLFVADCGWDIKIPELLQQLSSPKGSKQYRVLPAENTHKFPVQPLALGLINPPTIQVANVTSNPEVSLIVTETGAISAEIQFDLKDHSLPQVIELAHHLDEDREGKLKELGTTFLRDLAEQSRRFIQNPRLGGLETYRTIAIETLKSDAPAIELLETHREQLGQILRGEIEDLAPEQVDDALSVATSYFKGERVIVDTRNAVLLGKANCTDVSTVLGFAVIELAELKALESLLSKILEPKRSIGIRKNPKDEFPFKKGRFKLKDLHALETEIGKQLGRVYNPLDLFDDHYYADLRNLIAKRLGLEAWAEQVEKKLGVVKEISNNSNERGMHRFALAVEVGVFLLVAYEVWHIATGGK